MSKFLGPGYDAETGEPKFKHQGLIPGGFFNYYAYFGNLSARYQRSGFRVGREDLLDAINGEVSRWDSREVVSTFHVAVREKDAPKFLEGMLRAIWEQERD